MFRVALSPLCPLRHSLGSIVNPNLWRSGYCGVLDRGIKTGFAGKLPTVSLCAKEIVLLVEKNQLGAAYLYAMGSVAICCLVGLLLSAIIIKSTVARIVLNSFLASEDHRILKMAAIGTISGLMFKEVDTAYSQSNPIQSLAM
eukprot:scaffold1853_cov287-Chaetoceros_neogracile.AAC.14